MSDHLDTDRPASRRAVGSRWVLPAALASVFAVVAIALAVSTGGERDATRVATAAPSTIVESPSEPTTTTVPAPISDPAENAPAPTVPQAARPTGIEPDRLVIPAIGVDAPTVRLDLSGAEPEVPTNFDDTGWYEQTRLPGEIGPAVLAGHIDSKAGPAVFYRLDQLAAGDEIIVRSATGESRTFAVVASGQYLKDALPPEVFAFDQPEPELRLITCGGVFDRSVGHYRDNFVVYARSVPT